MSLGDPLYFVFLAAVFLVFHALAAGMPRRIWLLAASYFFYFEFSSYYIAVLLLVTLVTYFGARALRAPGQQCRGRWFWPLIAVMFTPLLVLRYGAALVRGSPGWEFLPAAIPVGISFFTFVAVGYLIDVHLEIEDPEPDFSKIALLLAFFPVISAGPVERGSRMLPQFGMPATFSARDGLNGLRMIFIGLVLKLIIATQLELAATSVLNAPPVTLMPLERFMGIVVNAFYMYADFAGYTLIAIGSAALFGLKVCPNFQQPFFSPTIPEFWRRWHMSLSFWVRDYIFAPLRTTWRGGGKTGMMAALFISFVTIGIWHGPKWGFLIFGVIHGTLAILSTLTLPARDAFWKRIGMPATLLATQRAVITFLLFALSLVPFCAPSLSASFHIYREIFSLDLVRNIQQAALWRGLHRGVPFVPTYLDNKPLP